MLCDAQRKKLSIDGFIGRVGNEWVRVVFSKL